MEKWKVYMQIQQLVSQGFRVRRIAEKLQISRNTVYQYLKRNPEDMALWMASCQTRSKKLDVHEETILHWLKEHPDLSASQVYDWLLEKRLVEQISESTVRNYVRQMRERHHIPKQILSRQLESVEDPPMGSQIQADFGETKVKDVHGRWVKLHFMSFVLSHSRFKYAYWLDRPFTSRDVVVAHEQAFQFFGGMTEEIVYDQDRLLVVSETAGEVIYTETFQSYRNERGFRVYLCRKADPESKGRIENVVGFIKKNFTRHRVLHNLDAWSDQFQSWLDRTGNGKVHNTTKKRPVEVFALEKPHLKPVSASPSLSALDSTSIARAVRKDNTIRYGGNRYTVPIGTYRYPSTTVYVKEEDGQLHIYVDDKERQHICSHPADMRKGVLIQNRTHLRDRSKGIESFMNHVAERFSHPEQAYGYLLAIRQHMPRFIRDQLTLISDTLSGIDRETADQALQMCLARQLHRASDFKDVVQHLLHGKDAERRTENSVPAHHVCSSKMDIKPELRDVKVYLEILQGRRPS